MTAARKLVLRSPAHDVTRIEALLELAGAESISLRDAGETPLLEPAPDRTPLWPEVELEALFGADDDVAGIAAWLGGLVGDAARIRLAPAETAPPPPIEPRAVGRRLAIAPADAAPRADGRIVVRLHMGLAFGTGEHPTTRLCLEWLERELRPGARVVDYGCGSGVLAIAALALGAAQARAVDIEPQALRATRANAELNGVAAGLRATMPDALAERGFDIVVANILAIPLIELAETFADLLRPGGRIALTGILDAQAEGVTSAYASRFDEFERRSSEGWSLLTARSRGTATGVAAARD